jgi:SnoaL-like domain
VGRSGREYPAEAGEIEPPARTADAPVTFKLKRANGVTCAIEVRLRRGTRVSPTQGRFGDLSGATHPDSRGRAALSRSRLDPGLNSDELATLVARHWVEALVRGDRAAAKRLYAPDSVIHTQSGVETGPKAVQSCIDRSPLLASRHSDAQIRESRSRVRISWGLSTEDLARVPASERRTQTTLRIAHGQIAEQWG